MYKALYEAYGPQHWWPAQIPDRLPDATEVVVGAILTQNTAWRNVEIAIAVMRERDCIDFEMIHAMCQVELAQVIRSAGTYRVKAARLKSFAAWVIGEHRGDLSAALAGGTVSIRRALLSISGIGPETADAILLYAGSHPTFVVDAYTKRILRRHRLIDEHATYDAIKALFETALPPDTQVFNEYHALLVEVGKRHCRTRADCHGCPLERWPHDETL